MQECDDSLKLFRSAITGKDYAFSDAMQEDESFWLQTHKIPKKDKTLEKKLPEEKIPKLIEPKPKPEVKIQPKKAITPITPTR